MKVSILITASSLMAGALSAPVNSSTTPDQTDGKLTLSDETVQALSERLDVSPAYLTELLELKYEDDDSTSESGEYRRSADPHFTLSHPGNSWFNRPYDPAWKRSAEADPHFTLSHPGNSWFNRPYDPAWKRSAEADPHFTLSHPGNSWFNRPYDPAWKRSAEADPHFTLSHPGNSWFNRPYDPAW